MTTDVPLPPEEEDAMLAAEYAMGLLPEEERAAFEARLRAEPALVAEVQGWSERLAQMVNDVAEMPPARLKGALQARLFPEVPETRGLRWVWQALGGLGFAALAAVAVFFYVQPGPVEDPVPGVVLAAEVAAEDDSLRLLAVYTGDAGTLRLTRTNGAAPEGRVLELWLIAGEAAPYSLGVLPEAEMASIDVPPDLRALIEGGTLAITDEPPGGAPGGVATGEVRAIGAVTSL